MNSCRANQHADEKQRLLAAEKETARLAWEDVFAIGTGFKYPQNLTQKLMVVVLVMGFDYYYYYTIWMSLVTGLFFLALLLNQW